MDATFAVAKRKPKKNQFFILFLLFFAAAAFSLDLPEHLVYISSNFLLKHTTTINIEGL